MPFFALEAADQFLLNAPIFIFTPRIILFALLIISFSDQYTLIHDVNNFPYTKNLLKTTL